MQYIIKIKGIDWLIDLDRKLLIKKNDPETFRELNLDQIDWFTAHIHAMYPQRFS